MHYEKKTIQRQRQPREKPEKNNGPEDSERKKYIPEENDFKGTTEEVPYM